MKLIRIPPARFATQYPRFVVATALSTGLVLTVPTGAIAAAAGTGSGGAMVHCTSDLPEFGRLSVTKVMPNGTAGFFQLGNPTVSTHNRFIGTCTLSGVIPTGWTVNEAPDVALAAIPGSGNAGTFVWNGTEDDAVISDPGTFVNSGTFSDDAVGFVQYLSVEKFVNTGAVVSNSPGFGAEGTTASPSCPTCTFVNLGALRVGAKAAFVSSSIFQLPVGGTVSVTPGGEFDVANESTFDIEGGSAKGRVVTGQFLGQGPATIEFAANLPTASQGTVDIATTANLTGVIAKHWTVDNTGGSIAASGSGNAGTFVMEPGLDDATVSDATPFTNSGTFIDDATGFAQSIEVPRFVNAGSFEVNAPDFSVAAPTGVTPVFVENGALMVGPKGGFSAAGVFDLSGTIVDHGVFSIDGTTLNVDGGSVMGRPLTALYHLGATAGTIKFGPSEATSSGAVDIGITMTLEGVIPTHWTVEGGGGTTITAENSGNNGTIDWTGNGHFSAGATFVNRGTVSVQGDTGMYVSVADFVDAPKSHTLVNRGADFSLTGNLSNFGALNLTNSSATVSGNYEQSATSVLGVEVANNDTSGELKVGGNAGLAGALAVSKSKAYSPRTGDTQQVVTAHLTTGRFRPVSGTNYGGGLVSTVNYSADRGSHVGGAQGWLVTVAN